MNYIIYKGLIKKLYREFMIMGFISFVILIATEGDIMPNTSKNEWYMLAIKYILYYNIFIYIQLVNE